MAITRPVFIPPSWYTGETAEQIQSRMMERLPPDIDNIEGGFPYDFTMPTALEEDELINFVLIETLKIMFPAWSYGQYMDYHAASAGLSRRAAAHAMGNITVTGVPGTQIPEGTIFCVPAVGDTPAIEYITEELGVVGAAEAGEEYGTATINIKAVEGGVTGNVAAGTITIMSTKITGVTAVTNEEAITGGTHEESDDELYERVAMQEKNTGESFVGCDADYIRWAKEVEGVGTVLVDAQYEESHPNWVKLIILDSNGQPAQPQKLAEVYEHIMHPGNRSIERLAPVGAVLVVTAPEKGDMDIEITGLQITGTSTIQDITTRFVSALETYYIEAKEDAAVKWNRVHAIFTGIEGVGDFETLTINGSTDNIEIMAGDYPVTNSIIIDGVQVYPEEGD